jgi:hypothetical protein
LIWSSSCEAVERRALHPDVEEDQIARRAVGSIAASALSASWAVRVSWPSSLEDARDESRGCRFVVDDENVRRHLLLPPATPGQPVLCSFGRGGGRPPFRADSRNQAGSSLIIAPVAAVESSGASWSSSVPPWSSMIFLTMARPRPVPFSRVVM